MRCSKSRNCCRKKKQWNLTDQRLVLEFIFSWRSWTSQKAKQLHLNLSTWALRPIYDRGHTHRYPMQTTATWWMVVQHQRPAIGPATSFILKRQRHQRSTAHQKVPLPVAKSRTAFYIAGWKVTRITKEFRSVLHPYKWTVSKENRSS